MLLRLEYVSCLLYGVKQHVLRKRPRRLCHAHAVTCKQFHVNFKAEHLLMGSTINTALLPQHTISLLVLSSLL